WKQKQLFLGGPSSQAPHPASSSNCTICCCTLAARPDGSDGNRCIQCGCGLYSGAHPESRHHWGFSGGGNGESTKPGITYQKPQGAQAAGPVVCGPCSLESKLFLEHAQNQGDKKPYKDFNKVLRQCQIENGLVKKFKLKKWKSALNN
ncbi:Coiled-coil-helix-coiled-coil-helix domain-containing protein 2, partial [Lemmus lemmus]